LQCGEEVMSFPKQYVGHGFSRIFGGSGPVIEVFLDLHCPFSKKAYARLKEVVNHYGEQRVQFVMFNWIQPWHPQATWLHQAALAASIFDRDLYWKMVDLIYERQDEFRDDKVQDVSRRQFFDLMGDYGKELGVEKQAFVEKMSSPDVIQLMKWELKYGRQNGIHSSPTYLINGLLAADVSSGWTLEQWQKLLDPLVSE